jgi:hypothetical protein
MKRGKVHIPAFIVIAAALAIAVILPPPANAFDLGLGSMDTGDFAMGAGVYRAPSGAESDSGMYSFARYQLSQLAFEIDYGLSDQPFFLGAADYLYDVPTAAGITQTEVAIGGGITFVNNDPAFDDSQFGPNLLGQVRFMDNLAVQVRYDFLGESANLWTFGLSYAFY